MAYRQLLLAILVFGISNAFGQSAWDAYTPSTFASIIDQSRTDVEAADIYFSANSFPSRVRVIWTGKVRTIDTERKAFISQFFKFIRRPEGEAIFQKEVLVLEHNQEHWLPIQESLIAYLYKEVPAGEPILVFSMWMGAAKTARGHEWIFGVNEFNAIK